MELVTDSMHQIAKKTEQETVSMKIITLVTLFFLPGTFISVSQAQTYFKTIRQYPNRLLTMKFRYLQTIMSTDILQFSSNQEEFSPKALQIYLAVTIPFMALTFGAWRVLYVLSKRREENRGKEMVSRVSSGNFFIV
jgi:hypothetical protein